MPTRRLGGDASPAAYVPTPTLAAAALDSAGAVGLLPETQTIWLRMVVLLLSFARHTWLLPTLVECLAKHS